MKQARPYERLRWSPERTARGERSIAEETPVAIVHDGSTTAVLMATPADLEDFAIGFSLTEGVASSVGDIADVDVIEGPDGVEARVWLTRDASAMQSVRRRRLAGPTGCGLCGVESLAEAVKPAARVSACFTVSARTLLRAMEAMAAEQPLGRRTRAAHAAGFWRDGALVAVREDVGRHNALDKLVGALARTNEDAAGVVLLTSRVSVEMVQKTAALGAPILCAVSAPTSLAIRTAEAAGITLVAVCRADGFEVFSHPERLILNDDAAKGRYCPPPGSDGLRPNSPAA